MTSRSSSADANLAGTRGFELSVMPLSQSLSARGVMLYVYDGCSLRSARHRAKYVGHPGIVLGKGPMQTYRRLSTAIVRPRYRG